MAFELLTNLNESVKADEQHRALLEDFTSELFGDTSAASYDDYVAAWERGKEVLEKQLTEMKASELYTEMSQGAMDRAGEREWMAQVSQDSGDMKRAKQKTLGLTDKSAPAEGEVVVLGAGGLGSIVAVDAESASVIIRDKSGTEKVFKNDDLLGPKMVNGKKAWALQGATPGTRGAR